MAGYTRQSTYADGDIINAADSNNEFNQVLAAFVNTSGHKHDGTAAEGPVIGLIGDPGVATPLNKVVVDDTNNRIGVFVDAGGAGSTVEQLRFQDGAILPVTTNDVDIGSSSLKFKELHLAGAANIAGTMTLSGNVIVSGTLGADLIPDADNTRDIGSSSAEWKDLYIDGVAYVDAINLDGTAISATAAELNIMDGVTSTTAELNILDGVTSTAAELNILDGVTSTTAELNILDGVTSTAAELNILDGVTSTAAELNILDGVTSTAAELNVLDGVTAFVDEDNMASDSATSIPSQQSVKAYVTTVAAANETHIDNAVTLTGVAKDATHLGTFTGSTIADSSTIKASLQALETAVESAEESSVITEIDGNVNDLITLSGVAENTANLGAFSGSIIADNETVKGALQDLEDQAGNITLTNLDIDGATGGTIATTSLFIIDEGADGTNKKATGSALATFVAAQKSVKDLKANSTSADSEPASYYFLVVDASDGSVHAINKQFVETEGSP